MVDCPKCSLAMIPMVEPKSLKTVFGCAIHGRTEHEVKGDVAGHEFHGNQWGGATTQGHFGSPGHPFHLPGHSELLGEKGQPMTALHKEAVQLVQHIPDVLAKAYAKTDPEAFEDDSKEPQPWSDAVTRASHQLDTAGIKLIGEKNWHKLADDKLSTANGYYEQGKSDGTLEQDVAAGVTEAAKSSNTMEAAHHLANSWATLFASQNPS